MFIKLPRELRDFVYARMFGDVTSIRIVPPRRLINAEQSFPSMATAQNTFGHAQPQRKRETTLSRTHPSRLDEIGPCHVFFPPNSYNDQNLPYWLTDVGDQALEEIASVLYTCTTFVIEHPYDIPAFLSRGVLGSRLSLAPLDLVRHLRLRLSFDIHPVEYPRGLQVNVYEIEGIATATDFRRQVHQISGVCDLKHVSKLRVTIEVSTQHYGIAEGFEEALVPLVYDLKSRGACVDVRGSGIATTYTFNYDVPRADWDERIRIRGVLIRSV